MARHLLAHDRLIPMSELVAQVSAVTVDDMKAFAKKLTTSVPTVALAGSGKRSRAQAERVAALFATPKGARGAARRGAARATKAEA